MPHTGPALHHVLAQRLLQVLDLTSLGEDDSPHRIEALCAAAAGARPTPVAVCVYPEHVTTARRALQGTLVRVATVVNFPEGDASPEHVSRETRRALAAGADEIDMVFDYRAFLRGDVALAREGVMACREACGADTTLKLIVETGELADGGLIRRAGRIGIEAGANFLKTSTGKVAVNATPTAAAALLDVIAATGGTCGLKVSGGIRTLEDAAAYLALADARMGPGWVTPHHFRIGASALFNVLLDALPPAGRRS